MPTPVKVDRLEKLLDGYDADKKAYLCDGFRNGFPLELNEDAQFLSQADTPPTLNHNSALRQHEAISKKFDSELQKGRLAGPFDKPPFDNYMVSPMAAAAKKTPGEYRPIHNLSFPKGASVNDSIDKEKGETHYQTMDNVIDSINQVGQGCSLIISDIKDAYKIIPIKPSDVPKCGIFWQGKYYFDLTLAMGCRTSAKIFESFATAFEWILKHKFGFSHPHHVLDDFCCVVKFTEQTEKTLKLFMQICDYLGIPVKVEKNQAGFIVIYLGVELDTCKMEARLPKEKLDRCRDKIDFVISRKSVAQHTLSSLAGLLNFACKVIRPGRPFLRRLYDYINTVEGKFHHVRIHPQLKADLTMWQTFLSTYNGVTLFLEPSWHNSHTLFCYTDSSKLGYGLVFGQNWVYGPFNQHWKRFDIMMLEAYPVMLLFHMFPQELANKRVLLYIDNESLVSCINKQTTKHKGTMCLLRSIVLQALKFNILFKAEHVPGISNTLADPLSRLQVDIFRQRVREDGWTMNQDPEIVPEGLLPDHFVLD